MICFFRKIGDKTIIIKIEDEVYNAQKSIFDYLFCTFDKDYGNFTNIQLYNVSTIYFSGTNERESSLCDKSFDFYHCCDFLVDNWVNVITNFLDYCYSKILSYTVLHASCVIVGGKVLLLLGSTMSGKTTLTKYLTQFNNTIYIDDDSVYIYHGKAVGFCSPIRMRRNCDDLKIIEIERNNNRIERFTYNINSCGSVSNTKKIDYLFFIKYNPNTKIMTKEIYGNDITQRVIENSKYSPSISCLYKDTIELVKKARCFEVEYNSCDDVLKFIEKLP